MRAVTNASDPGRAAVYWNEGRGPTRIKRVWDEDSVRDRAIADLELEDELAAGPELAGCEDS